jgi:hypothetical protein
MLAKCQEQMQGRVGTRRIPCGPIAVGTAHIADPD